MPPKCKLTQHAVEGLIQHFEQHPCCINNCVVGICGLPDNIGNYCKSCFSNEKYCGNIKSGNQSLSDSEKKKQFHDIVDANRTAWSRYFIQENNTPTVKSEKRAQLAKELKIYFNKYCDPRNDNRKWESAYRLRMPDLSEVQVCRTAWCAINGLSINGVEWIQRKLRQFKGANLTVGALDGVDDEVNMKTAFEHFGIDIEGCHSYISNFVELHEVPESEASLVLVCWLADYFDLIGEEQPGARVVHYDPIPLKEIWEQYKVKICMK